MAPTAATAAAAAAATAAADLQPRARRGPIGEVDNAALTEGDMMELLPAAAGTPAGLVAHNVDAYNAFIETGVPHILQELFDVKRVVKNARDQTEEDRRLDSVEIGLRFTDVEVGRPTYATYPIGKIMPLLPNEARLSGRSYAAPLTLGAEVTMTAFYADGHSETKRAEIPPFQVARIPMMVGSSRCHTWQLTREGRKAIEEDPNEMGGYFVLKGQEWVVDWLENIKFNALHVHLRMQPNERVRGEFISQPGGVFENSSQVIVRFMTTGAITIEINSVKFSKTRIPFFVIFRMLGMTSDAEILEQIAYDPGNSSPVARHMVDAVNAALLFRDPAYEAVHDELDRETLVEFMAVRLSDFVVNPTAYKSNEHAVQYLNTHLLGILDRFLLPHVGRDEGSRLLKLRYLGMMMHKTLLVDMGVLEPTDRDSYSNKRVHGPGVSLAKAFKTQFNGGVVSPALRALSRLVRTHAFAAVTPQIIADAFKSPLASSDLGRTLEQAIVSGTGGTVVIGRRLVANRVSAAALERKNYMNFFGSLRAVSANSGSQASKATVRADMQRRVHSSFPGFICVAKSPDTGEKVGMPKELAVTATICSAGEAFPLVLRLRADPAVTPVAEVRTPDLLRENLACVFVNGAWVGCCRSAPALVARYRALRRESRVVDPRTSIVWNPVTDDVDFFLDVGRLVRPLFIVDNNIEAYDAGCRAAFRARKSDAGAAGDAAAAPRAAFVQNIRLTPAHVAGMRAGTVSLEDLRAEGVLEWVTPEEAENCLVAPSLDALRARAGDVTARFTHCDVEQAIFGLTALVSPFGNHTQPARVTYETNQGRQAGGWYSLAAPWRADKGRFFQHYTETPLVRTIAYNWLLPNGMNAVVAYMITDGYNQEDSAVLSAAFVQRGGFAGAYFRTEKAELEKHESFGNPDPLTTKNLKPNASYEKLVDGFVPEGAVVRNGDVLIGRVARIQPGARPRGGAAGAAGAAAAAAEDDGYDFIDRSVVYHGSEPAVVAGVVRARGPNDNLFGLVKLRYYRPLGVGDKLSSRAGNKSINAILVPDSDLPYDEDGMTPDIIINPHAIPSRMTIGQMIETLLGLRCQVEGTIADGTSFRKVDVDALSREAAEVGLRYNGLSRLYNGRTGEYYDAAIFVGPTFHQRLQKFVKDDEYAVARGPTDALTGQPLDGKNARGGLRIGEMENWVLQSHGAMATTAEKMFLDSDGMTQFVCRGCGLPAVFNARLEIYRCTSCGEAADIVSVDSCRASIVAQHEIRTTNIEVSFGLRPPEFEESPSES